MWDVYGVLREEEAVYPRLPTTFEQVVQNSWHRRYMYVHGLRGHGGRPDGDRPPQRFSRGARVLVAFGMSWCHHRHRRGCAFEESHKLRDCKGLLRPTKGNVPLRQPEKEKKDVSTPSTAM